MKKNSFISHITKFLRFLPEKNQIFLSSIFLRIKENKAIEYDYSNFWDNLLKIALNDYNSNLLKIRIFQSFSVDWDNTPRYKEKAHYFNNSSIQTFKEKVSQLIAIIKSKNEDDIVFINAWNEWSEGAYLEPDTKNEYNYLKILKEVK
jgi:hypothetical protein